MISLDLALSRESFIERYMSWTIILWDDINETLVKEALDLNPSPITSVRFVKWGWE